MTYQTFEDAHFIDSGLCGGTPESWESTRSTSGANTLKMTYISENGAIWGVPIDYENYTTLTLDNSGVARDVDGVGAGNEGTIGLPCTGHPFVSGQDIWITGAAGGAFSYNGQQTLTSGTTANELQFLDDFWAETFDGTETVVQYMYLGVVLGSSQGRMDYDEDGNMYFGYDDGVAKISFDGITIDDSFFSPGDAFSGACLGVKVTSDSSYIYICFDSHKLYKFDLSDGSEEWQVATGTTDNYDIDVDADDNVYVCRASIKALSIFSDFYRLRKFAAANGSITTFDYLPSTYSIVVDDDMGRVICGSSHQWRAVDTAYYQGNLFSTDLDGANQLSTQLGTPIPVGVFGLYYGPVIPTGCIITYGDYIYVLCGGRIYKLNSDLTPATSDVAAPTYAVGLFVDLEGQIVMVCQDWSVAPQDEIFLFYDTDLNYLDKIGGFYNGMLDTWDAATGWQYIQGNILFMYEAPPYGSATYATSITQKRNLWFPSDYCHLIGETVKEFVDGEILDDEVVAGDGTVTASGTYEHIGLAFTYKLKPMRLVFSARKGTNLGSIKHLNEMVVNFLDTLNAKYGKDTDNLYDITWASATEFFSGDYTVALDSGFGKDDDVLISGDSPVPCNIRSMIPRVDVTGR